MRWLVVLAACSSPSSEPPTAEPTQARPTAPTPYGVIAPAGRLASLDDLPWTKSEYRIERGRFDAATASNFELSTTSGQLVPGAPLEVVVVVDDTAARDVVSYVWVYGLRDGRPVLLDTVATTRQKNVRQIYGAEIENGALVIERLFCEPETPADAVDCPRTLQVETWAWNGTRFVEDVARRTTRVP